MLIAELPLAIQHPYHICFHDDLCQLLGGPPPSEQNCSPAAKILKLRLPFFHFRLQCQVVLVERRISSTSSVLHNPVAI